MTYTHLAAIAIATVVIGGSILGGASMIMSQQAQIAAQHHKDAEAAAWSTDWAARQAQDRWDHEHCRYNPNTGHYEDCQ